MRSIKEEEKAIQTIKGQHKNYPRKGKKMKEKGEKIKGEKRKKSKTN
jgi:hypothetical protein